MKNTFIKYILLALAPPPPSIVDIDVIDVIKISRALLLRFDSGKAKEWYYSISLSVKTVLVMKKLTKLCCIPATFSAIWKWNRDYKIVMWIAGHHSLPYEYLAKQTLLLHLLKELSNCQLPGRDGRRWGRREGMGMKGRREKGREWGEENKGKSDCKREKNEWEGGRRVCATCRLTWSAFCDWSIFDLMESSSTSLFIDWAVSLSTCEKGHFIYTQQSLSIQVWEWVFSHPQVWEWVFSYPQVWEWVFSYPQVWEWVFSYPQIWEWVLSYQIWEVLSCQIHIHWKRWNAGQGPEDEGMGLF